MLSCLPCFAGWLTIWELTLESKYNSVVRNLLIGFIFRKLVSYTMNNGLYNIIEWVPLLLAGIVACPLVGIFRVFSATWTVNNKIFNWIAHHPWASMTVRPSVERHHKMTCRPYSVQFFDRWALLAVCSRVIHSDSLLLLQKNSYMWSSLIWCCPFLLSSMISASRHDQVNSTGKVIFVEAAGCNLPESVSRCLRVVYRASREVYLHDCLWSAH